MKPYKFTAETQRRGILIASFFGSSMMAMLLVVSCLYFVGTISAQTETPPAPGTPKSGTVPAVQEKKLGNGLTVAVVERKSVPLVTIQLLVKTGASAEDANKAGLADLMASMLTKGTKTKTATQIAEAIEFLGGSINSGASWNSSFVSVTVTSDKVDQAMAILADVVLNPKFDQKELDLLKSQTLDGLTYNLKQPSFLANYVASKYSFDEHPAGGTPASLSELTSRIVTDFHNKNFLPEKSILIFAGDISTVNANSLAKQFFSSWKRGGASKQNLRESTRYTVVGDPGYSTRPITKAVISQINKFLVIDVPNSGQAAVTYVRKIQVGRNERLGFYPALVLNSVLGGGYSSRLNQEIRIKRGLSYGANSGFAWRKDASNFAARAQTKNESAAEVAELILQEIDRLSKTSLSRDELTPRQFVLTGNFGRDLETNAGLSAKLAELYSFDIPAAELSSYIYSVDNIQPNELTVFAIQNLESGDIIIVGDYAKFRDDLTKRFPNMKVDVIKAEELDLSKDSLRK